MATNEEVLTPKALVLPTVNPANSQKSASVGTICMSGAKLFIFTGSVWEKVTSA